jgi:prophage DNA circulation protein
MSERILEAKYTSPGGGEAVFEYETVSRETELKTGVFTFPGVDGAHVQHQGMGARSFPLSCIFSGAACMDEADAFETMLIETGVGELRHPYGTIKVTPTGNIKREDDLVGGINQSTVTVTFTETLTDDAGEGGLEAAAADDIEKKEEEFSEAAEEDFARGLTTDAEGTSVADKYGADEDGPDMTIEEQLAAQSALEQQTQIIVENLEPLAAADKKAYPEWLASVKELKDKIQNMYKKTLDAAGKVEKFYAKALGIARLTLRIMKTPARLANSLALKIAGYSQVTAQLINQFKNDPFGVRKIANAYTIARLGLTAALASIASGAAISVAEAAAVSAKSGSAGNARAASGAAGAAVVSGGSGAAKSGGGVMSREAAVEAAAAVEKLFEATAVFSDGKIAQNTFIDNDARASLLLRELTEQSIQLIVEAAFSLAMQKTVTLGRDRQVIELCAELYGSVETSVIDGFIQQNNLNIDEIGLIPMGREVSYYV